MIQEFDISITYFGDDKYLVRTENVAPGVPLAQEQVEWPIEDWLQQSTAIMHDPLLGLLKGQTNQRWSQQSNYRSGDSQETPQDDKVPSLVGLGQSLYNKLFYGMLRDSWMTAQGIAQNRRHVLRLRLGIKDARLLQLPWEALHAGDRPLATGTDVTFSRYYPDLRQGREQTIPTEPDLSQPLRILMVIAAPNDQDRLELKREVHHLQSELHPVGYRSGTDGNPSDFAEETAQQTLDIQLKILEQPGRAELTQALEQGDFQILHYAGHSNLGNAGGDLYLVSRQTGLTERLSGEDLAGLLVNNGVKLAVFNSCRGAYTSAKDAEMGWQEQNLAQALVNRGVPGVIAMAERIPDDVAITFTRLLYRNLKQGHPIDMSLNRTRQGLVSAHGSHQFYWALPILYMQPSFDGYLSSQRVSKDSSLDNLLFKPASLAADPLAQKASSVPLVNASESASEDIDPVVVPVEVPPPSKQPVVQPVVSQSTAQSTTTTPSGDEVQPTALEDADLDDLVETLEFEELLSYNDDAEVMADLVEQLSQPPTQDESLILAHDDESLLPETLETPGLSIYEDLPENPQHQEAETSSPLTSVLQSPSESGTATQSRAEPATVGAGVGAGLQMTSASKRQRWWRRHGKQAIFFGITGALLLGTVGLSVNDPFNWFDGSRTQGGPSSPDNVLGTIEQLDLSNRVILAFNQRDFDEATQILGTLIAQDDYRQTIEILNEVDPVYLERPEVAFLRGRAQWELIRQKNDNYGPNDARLLWQQAVEGEPTWTDAQIALGFAYYAEGNLDEAILVWNNIVDNNARQTFEPISGEAALVRNGSLPTDLNAYAGLAMAFYRQAQEEADPDEKEYLMSQALSYQLKVLLEGETTFQPKELAKNWLWLESAIADWRQAQAGLAEYVKAQRAI